MKGFIADLNEKKDCLHPVLFAAFAHRRLVDIHPFSDGNGRTARLLMNLIFVNKGYCVVSIPPVLRNDYISALMAAQWANNPTDAPFNTLIAECELEAQRDYCRMFGIPLKTEREAAPKKPSIHEQLQRDTKSTPGAVKKKKPTEHEV